MKVFRKLKTKAERRRLKTKKRRKGNANLQSVDKVIQQAHDYFKDLGLF